MRKMDEPMFTSTSWTKALTFRNDTWTGAVIFSLVASMNIFRVLIPS